MSKIPISAERIREAKSLFLKGEYKASAERLRMVREQLEKFERKLK